jgi:hypothetical protein
MIWPLIVSGAIYDGVPVRLLLTASPMRVRCMVRFCLLSTLAAPKSTYCARRSVDAMEKGKRVD